jgi:hypothetical protein
MVPDGSRWFQMVPDGSPEGIPLGQMVAGIVNALTVNNLKQSAPRGSLSEGILRIGKTIWNNLEPPETTCPQGVPFRPKGFLSQGILRIGKESYGLGKPPD